MIIELRSRESWFGLLNFAWNVVGICIGIRKTLLQKTPLPSEPFVIGKEVSSCDHQMKTHTQHLPITQESLKTYKEDRRGLHSKKKQTYKIWKCGNMVKQLGNEKDVFKRWLNYTLKRRIRKKSK